MKNIVCAAVELRGLAGNKLPSLMRFFFVYEKEKLSHIIIWRSFSDEVHGEKDIKIGKLFTAKSLKRLDQSEVLNWKVSVTLKTEFCPKD